MTEGTRPSDAAPGTARQARLVGALMGCQEGRRLLEDARACGINLGGERNQAGQPTPLHLSSTAIFMIQDVQALCRQVDPNGSDFSHKERAIKIAEQLIKTANRHIYAEPVVNYAQPRPTAVHVVRPAFVPKPEFVK